MDNKRKLIIVAMVLILSCANFARLPNDNIRPIQYLYLLVIGGLFTSLIQLIVSRIKSKN